MWIPCPACDEYIDVSLAEPGERVICPQCRTGVRAPSQTEAKSSESSLTTVDDDLEPRPRHRPVVLPVAITTEPPAYTREKIEDLRERRESRRERRDYDREDRTGNSIGIAAFALTATALLFAISGWIFAESLRAYAWFTLVLAIPLTISGLPCGIVGALRPGRARLVAIVGVVLAATLLLVILPLMMIDLNSRK